jgi:sugar-specific transcriptional regulator TrmB
MEMDKVLATIGLNDKEAKVYLAILQLGTASVPRISERAGTKRPTTYLILEDLRKKRLVTKVMRGSVIIYSAESPEQLLEEERKKTVILENGLPDLLAIYNTKKEKPKVTYHQGEESIVRLYEHIFTHYKSEEILFYGSIGSISKEVRKEIDKHLITVKKEKIRAREILMSDPESIAFAKEHASENHILKLIEGDYKLPTDNIIYGDSVAIITYKETPMAVVIKSRDVSTTHRSMFEMLWNTI